MSTEWQKAKAEQLIRQQVEQIKRSQCPDPELCEGMIQMAYALSLLTDTGLGYWQRSLEVAVANRRQELVNAVINGHWRKQHDQRQSHNHARDDPSPAVAGFCLCG